MKVLHIYRTYFPDPPGGLQEAIRQISLSRARVVDTDFHAFAQSCARDSSIRKVRWRVPIVGAPASCDLGGLDALRQYRAHADWADVSHFHFPWPFADLLHLLGGRKKKPSVMTYHSDIVRQRALGYVYGPLMRATLRSCRLLSPRRRNMRGPAQFSRA